MKKLLSFIFIGLSIIGCKNNKQPAQNGNESVKDHNSQQTYAELTVKEGGNWNDHKYIGGKFHKVKELDLPKEHTDHSEFIKYEGPGWENSKVAYRIYLDWRNAIDIFGKKVDTLVLPYVGLEGLESYHDMSYWGQDILKVGNSLGMGGFGRFVKDSVVHFKNVGQTLVDISNNDKESGVHISYKNWQTGEDTIDLEAKLSIFPDNRYTKVELTPSKAISGLCTGIVKHGVQFLKSNEKTDGDWGYIATYGKQTLVNADDKLGMAIFYQKEQAEKISDEKYDHLITFKPKNGKIVYYFLGAWDLEPGGIKNEAQFKDYLEKVLQNFNENK